MAARAGARLADLEFVQFHPTALASGRDPLPLLTEALRGEGALLVDGAGRRFMPAEHPLAELAPRDVVARAIWRRRQDGQEVFLDARAAVGDRFPTRFPTVFARCREQGYDPRVELLPVTAAAHYHMGGIAVDLAGRSSLPGLWACGEVASTGAHGGNRLASNSLLEALVFGAEVGEALEAEAPERPDARQLWRHPGWSAGRRPAVAVAGTADQDLRRRVRGLAWSRVGVVRDGAGLLAALDELEHLAVAGPPVAGETRNLLEVARLVASAALLREESRGAHWRSDHPAPDPSAARRTVATAAELERAVAARASRPRSLAGSGA